MIAHITAPYAKTTWKVLSGIIFLRVLRPNLLRLNVMEIIIGPNSVITSTSIVRIKMKCSGNHILYCMNYRMNILWWVT